ncbi:unnamed protein product [Withania somnifera]
MASKVSILSSWTVKAGGSLIEEHPDNCEIIELTPWDVLELQIDYAQGGLLYLMPTSQQVSDLSKSTNTSSLIHHLRASLSRALDFFPPFCGRLEAARDHSGTTSFFINCNNAGVQFIHAIADGITVRDVLESNCVPHVVRNFFPLNGLKNLEATSQPFLALQVTELKDGIFIGCAVNHALVDGTSFWHFYGSWAEVSCGSSIISNIPYLKRQFPFKIDHLCNRISIPNEKLDVGDKFIPQAVKMLREGVFHFTKENVAKLKAKANLEMNTTKISYSSSCTTFKVSINMRERLNPPLPEGFFGNAIYPCHHNSQDGRAAQARIGTLQINEMIASHDHEKLKCIYENWMNNPEVTKLTDLPSNYFMLHN